MSNTVALPAVATERRISIATNDIFSTPESFEHAQRVAKVFASSNLIPQHLRGNVADCLIAYQIARRLNEEPLVVMQNIYVVSGKPGWQTSYMIARANRSGVFKGPITWESTGSGDSLSVTAKATLSEIGEKVSVTVDMRMAKAEEWTRNKKYQSMPEHMLRWRSAAMLIRLYAPEIMLGMPVIEEIETQPQEPRDVTPKSAADALTAFAAELSGADPDTGEIIDSAEADTQGAAPADQPPPANETGASAAPEKAAGEAAASSVHGSGDPAAEHPLFTAGAQAAANGMSRKAVPGEIRDDKDHVAIWLKGFDSFVKEGSLLDG